MVRQGTTRKSTGGKSSQAQTKDPRGGLTAEGRRYYKEKEGANLRPGVKGKADTPEKMKRKGSFLRRHYANLRGPLQDKDGNLTRLALQARAWGERAPKTEADAKKLAEKGAKLLEKYRDAKVSDKGKTSRVSSRSEKKSVAHKRNDRIK